ncbi:(Fe-S)-binding protein [Clostridium tetani]|uniref:(Fe-S)-binding protein n=1 Tax=Clostridium tetani TaxID=1513 RepID=A0A4Q0VCF4_CLOTA|nr:tRNA epoxyqueuosine(34) reductase QueG [Clostridium tetani]AVP54887.1 tRNA epoxyqueuosine(34) reductase QueG [Clostridium tetani]RXI48569.1 tRNA epoxyqueuosine(34) reductase QueG [Clostridium tetani]RXI75907.1 tRNA epoxyqueuosine(34) reductase QueG [Clostridium tetani]WFN62208.1 tRNA epoxyqueuosine(34) reductase QueG [Clostridium tetani]SUY54381.1 (Fe-S)-binding protein [Clostridium tetani]
MKDKKKLILDYCKDLGLDTVGMTDVRKINELEDYLVYRKEKGYENEFEEENIEKRINLGKVCNWGKVIISIAFPYMFNFKFEDGVYFSKYTQGRDYHKVVGEYLKKICCFIESLGGKAEYFVDSNCLPERYIAKLCGIGFIGKNNMIITEKYGSYVFLGEIITDLPLPKDNEKNNKCGQCDLCLKACPTKSIKEKESNPNICLSYLTQKKDLEDMWLDKLKGRLFGCDTCQRVCPFNREVEKSPLMELKPLDCMTNVHLEELISLNNKMFKDKYATSSCGWRGKNILIRNALINEFYYNKDGTLEGKNFNSPYIKDYYSRLLKLHNL